MSEAEEFARRSVEIFKRLRHRALPDAQEMLEEIEQTRGLIAPMQDK